MLFPFLGGQGPNPVYRPNNPHRPRSTRAKRPNVRNPRGRAARKAARAWELRLFDDNCPFHIRRQIVEKSQERYRRFVSARLR